MANNVPGSGNRGTLQPAAKPVQYVKCMACRSMVDGDKPACTSVVNCNEHRWKRAAR